MKVVISSARYPPDYSGAGLRTHRTYSRLMKKYHVQPVVISHSVVKLTQREEYYENMKIYRIYTGKTLVSKVIKLVNFFRKTGLSTYPIIHCVGSGFFSTAAALAARLCSMKVVMELTVNEMPKRSGLAGRLKDVIKYLRLGMIQRFVYKNTDMLIALNPSIHDFYISLGVPHHKIWLRPNPVDTDTFVFPTEKRRTCARREIGIQESAYVHLMIGGFNPRKNQLFALKYLQLLPPTHLLVMAGPVYNEYQDYLNEIKNFIRTSDLTHRVMVLEGFRTEVLELYHAADLFVLPSLYEGLPNVVLEALCCGLPVLVNKNLSLEYIVRDEINGWNLPLDTELFAHYALECERKFTNLEFRNGIAQEAKKHFTADFHDAELFNRLKLLSETHADRQTE